MPTLVWISKFVCRPVIFNLLSSGTPRNISADVKKLNGFTEKANALLELSKFDSADVQTLIRDIDLAIAAVLASQI